MSISARDQCWDLLPTRRISPFGHVPERAVDRAQPRRAQRHGVDDARRLAVEVDDVADAELVLDEDEHAGQEVLDQRLRAEAERDADDAGARRSAARG